MLSLSFKYKKGSDETPKTLPELNASAAQWRKATAKFRKETCTFKRPSERYRLSGITEEEVDQYRAREWYREATSYCSQAWKPRRQKHHLYYTTSDCWISHSFLSSGSTDPISLMTDQSTMARTLKRLPGVDDAVAVAVEEGGVLLKHAHAAGVAPLGSLRVARVHRLESSREICEPAGRDKKKRNQCTRSSWIIWLSPNQEINKPVYLVP